MVVGLIPLFNQLVENPEHGHASFRPSELQPFNGSKTQIKVPASFVRDWLTKGRRGFKSIITGSELSFPLVEYLGNISDRGEMVLLHLFLPTLFGGVISPVAQQKISVFYTALINLPVQPPINIEVRNSI